VPAGARLRAHQSEASVADEVNVMAHPHAPTQHPSVQGHCRLRTGLCGQTDTGEYGHHQAGADTSPGEEVGVPLPRLLARGPSRPRGDVTPTAVTRPGLPLRVVAGLWRRLWRTESCCRRPRVPRRWAASTTASSFCICRTAPSACCWLRHSWGDKRTSLSPATLPRHPATARGALPSRQHLWGWFGCPAPSRAPSSPSQHGVCSSLSPSAPSCPGTGMLRSGSDAPGGFSIILLLQGQSPASLGNPAAVLYPPPQGSDGALG